jgi:thymidylate kinase
MKLLTISGLDGSGKSTQIEMLRSELERQGSKVFYFHSIEFSLANQISKLFKKTPTGPESSARDSDENNDIQKSVTHATRFQIWLRKIFLRIDIWRFSLLRSKLRNNGYDYILSDRYFYDSIVNIEFLSAANGHPMSKCNWTSGVHLPDTAIYLQTSPEIIMSRDRVPDQGLEYLQKKKELYDAKTAIWNWTVINGNQEKNIIFEELKKFL